jgi:hypothetical protein
VQQNISRAGQERQFQELMKRHRTTHVIDWDKIVYGFFGLAFVVKGVLFLYRE